MPVLKFAALLLPAESSPGNVDEVSSLVDVPLVEADALVEPGPDEKPAAGGPPQAARRRATRAGLCIAVSAYPPARSMSALPQPGL
jgi:hypothetical protein